MSFYLFFIFNGLATVENGGTSKCRGNSDLIRVSIDFMQTRSGLYSHQVLVCIFFNLKSFQERKWTPCNNWINLASLSGLTTFDAICLPAVSWNVWLQKMAGLARHHKEPDGSYRSAEKNIWSHQRQLYETYSSAGYGRLQSGARRVTQYLR